MGAKEGAMSAVVFTIIVLCVVVGLVLGPMSSYGDLYDRLYGP